MSRAEKYCEECEATAAKLFGDPRDPPIDTSPCLCQDCYVNAINDEISDREGEIESLRAALNRLGGAK